MERGARSAFFRESSFSSFPFSCCSGLLGTAESGERRRRRRRERYGLVSSSFPTSTSSKELYLSANSVSNRRKYALKYTSSGVSAKFKVFL